MKLSVHNDLHYDITTLDQSVLVCGVGAIGSNITMSLARMGFNDITVIDHDTVDKHNAGNQVYGLDRFGAKKVLALQDIVFSTTNVEITSVGNKLTEQNLKKMIKGKTLIIDAMDDPLSRKLVTGLNTLHIGLSDGYGQIVWDHVYTLPTASNMPKTCQYAMAYPLVLLSVSIAMKSIMDYVVDGSKDSYEVTLNDLYVSKI
jgi:shikimate 5-dehydrogenase